MRAARTNPIPARQRTFEAPRNGQCGVCIVTASCCAAAFVLAAVVPLLNWQGLSLPDFVSNRLVIGVHDIRLLTDGTSTKRNAKWRSWYV